MGSIVMIQTKLKLSVSVQIRLDPREQGAQLLLLWLWHSVILQTKTLKTMSIMSVNNNKQMIK